MTHTALERCTESAALWRAELGEDALAQRVSESLDDLPGLLKQLGIARPLVVISRDAIRAAGLDARLATLLSGLDWTEFDRFEPNPTSDQAADAAQTAVAHRADGILAIGGGSCMDVAKGAAVGAPEPERLRLLTRAEGEPARPPLPVVAVPTTSGTGSETTHFAAIYVDGRKVSLAHPGLRPKAAILEVGLHEAMPRALAAVTGLDALCQAIESIWAVGSTDFSRVVAQRAGGLLAASIRSSVLRGDRASRRAMMIGAHLAGRAINISKTTAAHALSYQITQRFGVPHGHAAALTLGYVGAMNAAVLDGDCADPRGPEHVQRAAEDAACLLGVNPDGMPGAVAGLLRDLGLAEALGEAGVTRESIDDMAREVDPVRLGNNPRCLTVAQIGDMLRRAHAPSR